MRKKLYYLMMTLGVGCCSLAFNNVQTNVNSNEFVINSANILKENESSGVDYEEGTEITDGSIFASVDSISTTENSTSLTVTFDCNTQLEKDYFVGYYNSKCYMPAIIKCTLIDKNGNKKDAEGQLIRINELVEYNGIGPNLGQTSFTTYCDFLHGADYSLDLTSPIKAINILEYDFDAKTADSTNVHYLNIDTTYTDEDTGTTSKIYTEYDLSSFISFSYAGKSNLNGFSSFKVNVDAASKEVDGEGYKSLGTSYKRLYTTNQSAIENGSMMIRTRFGFSGDTVYRVTYDDGVVEEISDISNFVNVSSKGASLYFLLKGVDSNKVKNIQVVGGIITLGIYNNSTYKEVSRTGTQIRFGYMNFGIDDITNDNGSVAIAKSVNTYNFNSDLFIGLSIGAVTLVYVVVSIILFFVFTKKYKDDEFKRVNPKAYWKTNLLGLAAIDCVLIFIEFTVVRVNLISNSLPVFNPCDAFISAFAVASLLLVGYFIKYFYVLFKAKYERRRNEKLKMNNNVIDDGTLIIKK